MNCRDCNSEMKLIDNNGNVEVWQCPSCGKNTIISYGKEVIEELPEVKEWKNG